MELRLSPGPVWSWTQVLNQIHRLPFFGALCLTVNDMLSCLHSPQPRKTDSRFILQLPWFKSETKIRIIYFYPLSFKIKMEIVCNGLKGWQKDEAHLLKETTKWIESANFHTNIYFPDLQADLTYGPRLNTNISLQFCLAKPNTSLSPASEIQVRLIKCFS